MSQLVLYSDINAYSFKSYFSLREYVLERMYLNTGHIFHYIFHEKRTNNNELYIKSIFEKTSKDNNNKIEIKGKNYEYIDSTLEYKEKEEKIFAINIKEDDYVRNINFLSFNPENIGLPDGKFLKIKTKYYNFNENYLLFFRPEDVIEQIDKMEYYRINCQYKGMSEHAYISDIKNLKIYIEVCMVDMMRKGKDYKKAFEYFNEALKELENA